MLNNIPELNTKFSQQATACTLQSLLSKPSSSQNHSDKPDQLGGGANLQRQYIPNIIPKLILINNKSLQINKEDYSLGVLKSK